MSPTSDEDATFRAVEKSRKVAEAEKPGGIIGVLIGFGISFLLSKAGLVKGFTVGSFFIHLGIWCVCAWTLSALAKRGVLKRDQEMR